MEFFVNNGRKIQLEQTEPDGPVRVTTWAPPSGDGTTDCDSEYTISAGDFVMILNWYCHQKRTGNTDLNF